LTNKVKYDIIKVQKQREVNQMKVYVIMRYLDNECKGIDSIWKDREEAKTHWEKLNELSKVFNYELTEDYVI
jgi:hypothetical protein